MQLPLVEYNKKNARARRLILDEIKDHVIPHVRGKDNAFDMWASLNNLYQSSNENHKMVLKEKLKAIKMNKSEGVVAYLTRITNVKDELVAIGETIADLELVSTTSQGFPKSWKVFVKRIIAREHLLGWDRLWDDCI